MEVEEFQAPEGYVTLHNPDGTMLVCMAYEHFVWMCDVGHLAQEESGSTWLLTDSGRAYLAAERERYRKSLH